MLVNALSGYEERTRQAERKDRNPAEPPSTENVDKRKAERMKRGQRNSEKHTNLTQITTLPRHVNGGRPVVVTFVDWPTRGEG